MKSPFIIVADRGNLKAFRIEKTDNDRPPRLRQVQALAPIAPHQKISEINTDLAGRFPVAGASQGPRGNGLRHQNSIAERHYEIELDRRTCKELALRIEEVLGSENPRRWSFSAPSEINECILSEVSSEWRKKLAENLTLDLVNAPTSSLLQHFAVAPVET